MSPTVGTRPVRMVGGPHDGQIVNVTLGTRRITAIEFADPSVPSFSQVDHEIALLSNGEWVAVRCPPRKESVRS